MIALLNNLFDDFIYNLSDDNAMTDKGIELITAYFEDSEIKNRLFKVMQDLYITDSFDDIDDFEDKCIEYDLLHLKAFTEVVTDKERSTLEAIINNNTY